MTLNPEFLKEIQFLPDQLISQSFFHSQKVFSDDVVQQLRIAFEGRRQKLKTAHIGPIPSQQENTEVRNDQISWIDQSEKEFDPLFKLMDLLTQEIKRTLFLPLRRYELQMALYPKGHFYRLHVDQHRDYPNRLLTLVYYINDWTPADGGELRLKFSKDQKNQVQNKKPSGDRTNNQSLVDITNNQSLNLKSEILIAPQNNHMVLFMSELEHEVLLAHNERRSFTAWLRDDIL